MAREKALVKRLLIHLNNRPGVKVIKQHGSQFSEKGTPDLIGSNGGQFFAIETKREGEVITPIQKVRLDEWKKAGARVGVAVTLDEGLRIAGFDD